VVKDEADWAAGSSSKTVWPGLGRRKAANCGTPPGPTPVVTVTGRQQTARIAWTALIAKRQGTARLNHASHPSRGQRRAQRFTETEYDLAAGSRAPQTASPLVPRLGQPQVRHERCGIEWGERLFFSPAGPVALLGEAEAVVRVGTHVAVDSSLDKTSGRVGTVRRPGSASSEEKAYERNRHLTPVSVPPGTQI